MTLVETAANDQASYMQAFGRTHSVPAWSDDDSHARFLNTTTVSERYRYGLKL